MRHVWTVVCRQAIENAASKNYTLVEVIEQISLAPPPDATFPMHLPYDYSVVSLWARSNPDEPETGAVRMRVLGPNGEELGQAETTIDLAHHLRVRNRSNVPLLAIAGEGWHEFEIARQVENGEWVVEATVPMAVVFRPAEDDAEDTGT